MDLDVWPRGDGVPHHGEARWNGAMLPCALGRAGIRADKREGDSATPAGDFAFRRVLYRPDREAMPLARLAAAPIGEHDGWCDDPADPAYNRPVRLPYAARHERLWRPDGLYDLVLVIGHNDDPPVAGRGSAIFVHVARPDWGGTEGCIAFRVADLRRILAEGGPESRVRVHAERQAG
ncbi:MAG: L,D-transpeptidase family protein [Alphaproteobacteria bacterium]|nr:L,D-transpeptidase family protein [Alphaproteobacteria bacterium]